jgi:hypothetical protein
VGKLGRGSREGVPEEGSCVAGRGVGPWSDTTAEEHTLDCTIAKGNSEQMLGGGAQEHSSYK